MVFPNIEYVIFDMDGLLIDSETIYTQVTNEILSKYGKSMSWEIKAGLMGKPDREAAAHLLSFFPEIPLSIDAYLSERNVAQDRLWPTVPLLPGVEKLVRHLHAHRIPIAIATGSYRHHYTLKTQNLSSVFACFEGRVICADDMVVGGASEKRPRPKPHPDVFLLAAREKLGRAVGNAENGECTEAEREERKKGLVFEDALLGMQAGNRAGMSVVWVPDANILGVEYSGVEMADQTLNSIEDFVPEQWGLPPYES